MQDIPLLIAPNPKDPRLWPERESLKIALQYPSQAGSYFDGLSSDIFTNEAYSAVREAIVAAGGCASGGDGGVEWIAAVAGEMADLSGRNLVSELAVEALATEDDLATFTDSVLSRLQEQRVSNQIAQLKSQLQRMRPADDEQAYNTLFADIIALEQARREYNHRAFRM